MAASFSACDHRDDGGNLDAFGTVNARPRRGVYRSTASGFTVPSAATLWRLLHLDRARAVPQSDGAYRGKRRPITLETLARHLIGEIALAFSVLSGKRALFAALDIDKMFPDLLRVIREYMRVIGSDVLLDASFLTSGSDGGRGKIIICFEVAVATRLARRLVLQLFRRVRASELGCQLHSRDFSVFPQERSGGIVRILGRNVGRQGPLEHAFTLDGEPSDLSHVVPLSRCHLESFIGTIAPDLPPWVERTVATPWRRADGTDRHYKRMVALAREAIRLDGLVRGRERCDEWCDSIDRNSPELALPSLKNRDSRNVIRYSRERAWEYAKSSPTSWVPLELSERRGYARGVIRVYTALASFVRSNGLRPAAFALDYENLAFAMRVAKSTAYRWVERAEETGVLVRHDRGFRDVKGMRGAATLFGLVLQSQTAEGLRRAGGSSERVRQRLAERSDRSRPKGDEAEGGLL